MPEITVAPPGMDKRNSWFIVKRDELLNKFGNACQHCGEKRKLEFAHKIGFRIRGEGRGRNKRILEVLKNPDNFLLLCKWCHSKYDRENPLTEEEKIPF